MDHSRATYTLERITGPGPVLTEALRIYSQEMPTSIRTASNDIVYWSDRYEKSFGDELILFAFRLDNELIGFAQLVLFVDEKILVSDYIAIRLGYRRYYVFFQFVEQIRLYLDANQKEYDIAVAEVASFSLQDEPHEDGRVLIRLLKQAGFGVLKARYFQPPLGLRNPESMMRATLMILRNDPADCIQKETFLSIVRLLYYKHYLRWYEPLPGIDLVSYRRQIDKLMAKVEGDLTSDFVKINGHWEKPVEQTQPYRPRFWSPFIYLLFVLAAFAVFSIAWLTIGSRNVLLFALLSLVVVTTILACFSRKSFAVFSKLLNTFSRFFGKTK